MLYFAYAAAILATKGLTVAIASAKKVHLNLLIALIKACIKVSVKINSKHVTHCILEWLKQPYKVLFMYFFQSSVSGNFPTQEHVHIPELL